MRIEIIIFFIAGLIIFNIYTEGKYLKKVLAYKKYYQIGGVVFGAFFVWWLFKKNPKHAENILLSSNEYIKYLPVDKGTASFISPILDFTAKHGYSGGQQQVGGNSHPILQMPNPNQVSEERMMKSGKKATKRSVSETKKKFVAARQNWKCGDCQEQLTAWFEVDHKIRLEYGGSNHIDNLVALCRDCHGKKTTIENL
jgi:hypothetical protein